RGQDFAIYGRVGTRMDEEGNLVTVTNRSFTLLENALHYFEEGEWKEREDLIEPFPGGAIARRVPHKAIFSHNLNAEAVFDLESSAGDRLKGGVRAIQITDLASGQSAVLGEVKESAPGELLPPNQIVY